jgi:translation initiation factor IF-2
VPHHLNHLQLLIDSAIVAFARNEQGVITGGQQILLDKRTGGKADVDIVKKSFGKIAGSFVTDGMIKRGAKVRLLRDDIVIHEGHLKTLKRFKEDVKEVKAGYECGIAFENYEDIKENDKVEVFELIEEKRTLD